MREIKNIILHCSATVEGKTFTAADINKWHVLQGWKKIGYHYVICIDGKVEQGRKESEIGAHCVGYNKNSIGICYIGGVDKKMKPKDTRTEEQKNAMYKLINQLLDKYHLTIDNVHCHNEYSNKACPSFAINTFRNEYKNYINNKLK